jgi:flagellar motor switch protein FliG
MSIPEDFTGFEKAAVLLSVLGEPLAMTLFKSITESEMIKLRIRARELQHVPTLVKKAVMEEYYFKIMSEKYRDREETSDLFGFLNPLNDEQLYYLLGKEEIRLTAMALEQLEQKKRMTFLNKLNPERKNKIIMQIGNLDDIPLEAVINMAKDLEEKASFIPAPREFSRGGGRSVATILGEMTEDEGKQYLEQLKLDNPDLYGDVKKFYLAYEDIMNMPESMAAEFWMNPDIDLEVMAKALKGYDQEIQDKVIAYLPGKKQAMFTPIEGPMAKRDVDEARGKLLTMAKEKISAGDWLIDDILGSGGEFIE